jgi:O-acetyl-ADP-ribose deacetylase (regulator of RNase III)/NAD-dependent SIR2 family protein deacetylase
METEIVDLLFSRISDTKQKLSTLAKRRIIGDAFISSFEPNSVLWSEKMLENMDKLQEFESKRDEIVKVADIPVIFGNMRVWRGDITKIGVDAIVNAANSAMLGCLQPKHMCIDNVIHRKAGPRLRLDCLNEMNRQGKFSWEDGECLITRGFHLPCKYVIHSVGPQITRSDKSKGKFDIANPSPTEQQIEALQNCYRNCLQIAAENGIKSVGFCCVSTGLFGFPKNLASKIAIKTCLEWTKESKYDLDIIFNVFTSADEAFYSINMHEILEKEKKTYSVMNKLAFASPENEYSRVMDLFQSSEMVLIAAGAGFSAAEGLDYNSEELFQYLFPAMHDKGFRCMYEFIGYRKWSPALQWGYLLSSVNQARFNWKKPNGIYSQLKEILKSKDHFILTSNADGMFEQNGFDIDRLYTIQGDYSHLQCLAPCSNQTWPIKPIIDAVLPSISLKSQEITSPELIPKCINCGGPVMMNVRGGDWFIDDKFNSQRDSYLKWLERSVDKRLLIIELGVGYNTPSVIRWPMERIALSNRQSHLVRVNIDHSSIDDPETSRQLHDRYIPLRFHAAEILDILIISSHK